MNRRGFLASLGGLAAAAVAAPALLLQQSKTLRYQGCDVILDGPYAGESYILVDQNYADIIATTIHKHSDAIRDSVLRNNQLLALVKKRMQDAENSLANHIAHDLYSGHPTYESEEGESFEEVASWEYQRVAYPVSLSNPSNQEIPSFWSTV